MKGDFSRIRFNPAAQYTAVLKQQGRVDLDSDANEQSFIDGYIDGVTNTDVIGQYGGPAGNAGFAISISSGSIQIGSGRYYVDGLLVENPTTVDYDNQPWLYNPAYTSAELIAAVNAGGNTVQFVLEVWQQLVTGFDDTSLLEPALGQADTTVRLKTVWRVIGKVIKTSIVPAGATPEPANPVTELTPCCQYLYSATPETHSGLLSADTNGSGSECGCQPIASAGYQGLENQLYRVEIHDGGTVGTATFKWSRENASVVTAITNISGAVVTVSSLGPDANLGFGNSQWVELTDDTYTYAEAAVPAAQVGFPGLAGVPGQILQIQSINPATSQVTFSAPVTGINLNANPRMRRWDQSGALATTQGVVTSSTAVPLENGIEVTFSGGQFYPGDYWTIPARTANGAIDWPSTGSGSGVPLPPSYTQIYDAPLACMALRASSSSVPAAGQEDFGNYVVSDCRLTFSPLTSLNPQTGPGAIHVTSTSWKNDDVITVDQLVLNGLSITFDQVTTNPWGGGNFQVTMETPAVPNPLVVFEGQTGFPAVGNYPPGTNIFGRTVSAVDAPLGINVSGTQVTWMGQEVTSGLIEFETYYLYESFNTALNYSAPIGFARIRVRLDGGTIYANGPAGNLYLDGTAFGETGSRTADGSPCVSLSLPTGNNLKSADFASWFYLAPSLQISAMSLVLLNSAGTQVGTNAVTITGDRSGNITGIETTATTTAASVAVTTINVNLDFTYAAVAPVTLTFQLSYSGAVTTSIAAMASSVTINPGQSSVTVPLKVVGNPGVNASGGPNVETVTIGATLTGGLVPISFSQTQPTLVVTGVPNVTLATFGNIGLTGLKDVSISLQNAVDIAKRAIEPAKDDEAKDKQTPEPPKP